MPHLRCYRPAGSPRLTARSRQSVYQKRIAVSLLNKFKADCYFFFWHTSLVTADWYSPSGWYPLPLQPRGLPGSPIRPETVHGAYHRLQIPGQHWLRICPALSSHYCGHPFLSQSISYSLPGTSVIFIRPVFSSFFQSNFTHFALISLPSLSRINSLTVV